MIQRSEVCWEGGFVPREFGSCGLSIRVVSLNRVVKSSRCIVCYPFFSSEGWVWFRSTSASVQGPRRCLLSERLLYIDDEVEKVSWQTGAREINGAIPDG